MTDIAESRKGGAANAAPQVHDQKYLSQGRHATMPRLGLPCDAPEVVALREVLLASSAWATTTLANWPEHHPDVLAVLEIVERRAGRAAYRIAGTAHLDQVQRACRLLSRAASLLIALDSDGLADDGTDICRLGR